MNFNKGYYLILFLLLNITSNGQKKQSDTTFISLRKMDGRRVQAIYIDKNNQSPYYKRISHFSLDSDKEYIDEISGLRGSKQNLVKHIIPEIPKTWCPLYLYKSDYYVYSPSDYAMNNLVKITDSVFIQYWADGPTPEIIDTVIKKRENEFELIKSDKEKNKSRVIIHLINPAKGIAVFQYLGGMEVFIIFGLGIILLIPAIGLIGFGLYQFIPSDKFKTTHKTTSDE